MRYSKKLLSILLVVILCFSTVLISSVQATNDENVAFYFDSGCWVKSMANNRPAIVKSDNDGNLRIANDTLQQQYQVYLKVDEDNAERLKNAIELTNNFYDGFLCVDILVNKATTMYGSACRPSCTVTLQDKNQKTIATTGENSIQSKKSGRFLLNLTKYQEQEYNYDIAYVYVQVQCYDWTCGGGHGTIPDVTFQPIEVYTDEMEEPETVPTVPPDPNQKTFLKFQPEAKNDFEPRPEDLRYSSDGAVWKSETFATQANHGYLRASNTLNPTKQVQVNYGLSRMGEEAENAFNLAKSLGGFLKANIYLEKCYDEYGNSTIAEVAISINTDSKSDSKTYRCQAWQYPGTTRTYYLDLSGIVAFSDIASITIQVQNYWYYRAKTNELFDWDKESNYAGLEAAEAAGHTVCNIYPTFVVSPISVVQDSVKHVNTDYSLILKDFNKNGGKVPSKITVADPNLSTGGSDDVVVTTAGGGDGGNGGKVSAPSVKSFALSSSTSAKLTWGAVANATGYRVEYSTSSNFASPIVKNLGKVTSYNATGLVGGKTYYFRVKALGANSSVSAPSAVKSVKLINFKTKPSATVTAGAKKMSVKIKKQAQNATSYEIQYSTSKKFKSAKKTTVKAKKTKTIKKLSSRTVYYVRVRATQKIAGKTYVGKWSKAVKTTVK